MNERQTTTELTRDSLPGRGPTHDASRIGGRLFEIDNVFVSLNFLLEHINAGERPDECLEFLFDQWQDRKTVLSDRLEIILKEVATNE